jgi:hypothetical protein
MGATAALAAAVAGSAVVGAGTSIYGANKAASSAKDASNIQQQQYQTTRADLQPYFQPGYNALTAAGSLASSGPTGGGPDYVAQAAANLPGNMTQADLEKTPGYRFTLDQGLASVRARNASRGLGMSSAALKGAAEYATGLADKTYLDQFNVRQKNFEDMINLNTGQQGNLTGQFNRLNAIATLGENAAAGLGTIGQNAASTSGQYINAAGLDQAAGAQNATNALSSGVNNYLAYNAYTQRTGGYPTSGASGQNYGQPA